VPRILWNGLPPALRDHLFDRLRERKITAEELYELKAWRESNPSRPSHQPIAGHWLARRTTLI
jgi:hypothetical protein